MVLVGLDSGRGRNCSLYGHRHRTTPFHHGPDPQAHIDAGYDHADTMRIDDQAAHG